MGVINLHHWLGLSGFYGCFSSIRRHRVVVGAGDNGHQDNTIILLLCSIHWHHLPLDSTLTVTTGCYYEPKKYTRTHTHTHTHTYTHAHTYKHTYTHTHTLPHFLPFPPLIVHVQGENTTYKHIPSYPCHKLPLSTTFHHMFVHSLSKHRQSNYSNLRETYKPASDKRFTCI